VLAHGYHVQAEQWQDVVGGDPHHHHHHHLGRVPRAVLIALDQPNPLLLFDTGAKAGHGVLESEHTLHFARAHRCDLYDLAQESLTVSQERARLLVDDLLDERSTCERTSTTTRTEVAAALEVTLLRGARHLTLMPSPTHIARCLQTALMLLASNPRYHRLAGRIAAVASDTTVTGRGPGDVVILEPRTRRPAVAALTSADVARAALPLLGRPPAADDVDEWSQLTDTWLARTGDQDS